MSERFLRTFSNCLRCNLREHAWVCDIDTAHTLIEDDDEDENENEPLGARLPGASSTLESLLSYRPSWTRTNHDTQWRCGTDYKRQSYWVLVRTRIRRDLSYNRPARESGQCNEQP